MKKILCALAILLAATAHAQTTAPVQWPAAGNVVISAGAGNNSPTGITLGGTCGSNQWMTALSSVGSVTCSRPAASDISGQFTLAQFPTQANNTILGNVSGIGAVPSALSATQATTLCNVFSTTLSGCVAASGGGTTNFLRADGTWATPAGGGNVSTTGTPATGNLAKFSSATNITNADLAGDVTTSGTTTDTVAKIQGTTVSGTTGTGNVVFSTSPTLVTPALGTPASGNLANATGLPISTGVSGLGAGIATFLGTPSSANLLAALTTSTGTGNNVFAISPTLVTPNLGTPASGVATNLTGYTFANIVAGTNTGAFIINGAGSLAALPVVKTVSGTTRTFDINDENTIQNFTSATAVAATIPLNATVAYDVNTVINMEQNGAGAVTITGAAGVTVNGTSGGSCALSAQYSGTYIRKTATDTWVCQVMPSGSGVTNVTGTAPIVSSGGTTPAISISGVTSEQGNGAKLQLSTGSTTTNDLVKYDLNGNTIDSGNTLVNGTLTLGTANTTLGNIVLEGSTSGAVTVQPAAAAGTWSLTLPTTAGSNGQFLQTNGSGVAIWASATGSGTVNSGLSGQMTYYASTGTAVSGNANATISSGALTLGQAGTQGSVVLNGSTSGTTTVVPMAAAGSTTATLPANTGTVAEINLAQTWSAIQTFSSTIAQYISGGAVEFAVFSNGNSGTSMALNCDNGNVQSVTITGAVTFTFTTPTHPCKFTVLVTQDGTGHAYGFPASIIWPAGTAPTLSSAANAKDAVTVIWDGTNNWGEGNTAFATSR